MPARDAPSPGPCERRARIRLISRGHETQQQRSSHLYLFISVVSGHTHFRRHGRHGTWSESFMVCENSFSDVDEDNLLITPVTVNYCIGNTRDC